MKPRSDQDVWELLQPGAKLRLIFAKGKSGRHLVERVLELDHAISIAGEDRRRLERALKQRSWGDQGPETRKVRINLADHLDPLEYDHFLRLLATELFLGLDDISEVQEKRHGPAILVPVTSG